MPDPIRLLRRAIKRSGLSNRKYAEQVLTRDERTLRRWIAGRVPIPRAVVAWLRLQDGEKGKTGIGSAL